MCCLRSANLGLPIFDDPCQCVAIFGFETPLSARLVSFHEEDGIEAAVPIGKREALFIHEPSHEPLLIIRELVKLCSRIACLVGRWTVARALESPLIESPAHSKSREEGSSCDEDSESHESAQVMGSDQSQAAH